MAKKINKRFAAIPDKNGKHINPGDIIIHNSNHYVVKYSENMKKWILRVKDDTGMNWRDFEWLQRTGKYCEIIGNVNF